MGALLGAWSFFLKFLFKVLPPHARSCGGWLSPVSSRGLCSDTWCAWHHCLLNSVIIFFLFFPLFTPHHAEVCACGLRLMQTPLTR